MMKPVVKTYPIVVGTSATVSLPEPAVAVESVAYVAEGVAAFAATNMTVTTTAPADASHVQFTGTPEAPSSTLTLNAAPATAGGLMLVAFVPVGGVQASD